MNTELKTWIKILDKPVLIISVAIALTAILMNLQFHSLEAFFYDLRMNLAKNAKSSDNIVLITLDDETTKAAQDFAPLSLNHHVQFLEALEKYAPKAIGYLVNMNHVNQAYPELFEEEWGPRFVESARRFEQRNIPFVFGTPFDVNGEVLPPYPLSNLEHSISIIHRDGNHFSGDKITRRAVIDLYGRPAFHLSLLRASHAVSTDFTPRGSYYVPEADGNYFLFKYHQSNDPSDLFKYPHYSFIDITRNTIPLEKLKDKIILVSTYSRTNPADVVITPYKQNGAQTPTLTVHANILNSLINNNGIIATPFWLNALITFCLIVFVVSWVVQATPLKGLLATIGLASIFILMGHFLFLKGYALKESQPLIGILLGYYFVVPYRLMREYQKRADYQQKNELLIQVEELKTNFLSLITHDLKTPVARIQGLAEVLLRKSIERLNDKDIETIKKIMNSTEDLNRFISSILELTKVESDKLQLNLESKDVNLLIEQSVESFKAQARIKNIKLKHNLDPLFPVKIDPVLISKVINNLIDNAIKYSPTHSEVSISSREIDTWVEIAIKDQGIGLSSQDQEQLFTRFFRAKNEKTADVTGTGLGLYLTKYFIEAHDGQVKVISEIGAGTTFIILLPILNLANPVPYSSPTPKENYYV